jgi:hypothetical protein
LLCPYGCSSPPLTLLLVHSHRTATTQMLVQTSTLPVSRPLRSFCHRSLLMSLWLFNTPTDTAAHPFSSMPHCRCWCRHPLQGQQRSRQLDWGQHGANGSSRGPP